MLDRGVRDNCLIDDDAVGRIFVFRNNVIEELLKILHLICRVMVTQNARNESMTTCALIVRRRFREKYVPLSTSAVDLIVSCDLLFNTGCLSTLMGEMGSFFVGL